MTMRCLWPAVLASSLVLSACGGSSSNPTQTPTPPTVTAPDTTIASGPPAATTSSTATFTFSASQSGATFQASLDGASYSTVTSPATYSNLTPGTHTFSVRALDAAGNADATPATATWAVDVVPPLARIAFPTGTSYTGASTITVRGYAGDAHGVASVSVNNVAAISTDGFQTWQAVVPISVGFNLLTVSATDVAGNLATVAATASVMNSGPINYSFSGMDYDATGHRLIVADSLLNAIYYYQSDGVARVLSPTPGAANSLYGFADLVVDATGNRAILVEYYLDALISVDLTTGARQQLTSGPGSSAQTQFVSLSSITLDSTHTHAFVTNPVSATVIRVDLTTGARTLVSGGSAGSGVALSTPRDVVYDDVSVPGTPRLLVPQGGLGAGEIVAIDPATGIRTEAFPAPPGSTGPLLDTPVAIRLDALNQRLLVLDAALSSIFAIDLTTGNRTVLNGGAIGTGTALSPMAFPDNRSRLAFDVSGQRLFSNTTTSNLIATDLGTQQRTVFVDPHVGTGPAVNYPAGLVIEQPSGTAATLLFSDPFETYLTRLNLATGERMTVSDSLQGIGSGPALDGVTDIVLDTRASSNGHTALALLNGAAPSLLSVDLTNGNRTQIADLNSSAPAIYHARNMRLDAAGNRVLFTDAHRSVSNELYAIDLASGVRTTIMDATHGTGPNFNSAWNITLDLAASPARALISDTDLGGIFAVDLATGNRSMFIDPFPAVITPGDNIPTGTFLDRTGSRLLVVRQGTVNNIFSVAMTSGAQQILSGDNPGSTTAVGQGQSTYGCYAIDVNTTDSVAYLGCPAIGVVMAVDLLTGDRVVLAH